MADAFLSVEVFFVTLLFPSHFLAGSPPCPPNARLFGRLLTKSFPVPPLPSLGVECRLKWSRVRTAPDPKPRASHEFLASSCQSKVFSSVAVSQLRASVKPPLCAYCSCSLAYFSSETLVLALAIFEAPTKKLQTTPPPRVCLCPRTTHRQLPAVLLPRIVQTQTRKHDGPRYPPGYL
jgi:hypothetical protein